MNSLRLWGKITGTEKDYYIAEGAYDKGEEEAERPEDFEAHGTGINKSYYWATNSPFGFWTILPDISPSDLNAAREIKVCFTGDLDRTIVTNPFFFKKESFFLRAQIARIQHSTTLVPAQVYRFVEESTKEIEENVPDEGPIPVPSTQEMAKAENWRHFPLSVLRNGRCTMTEPVLADGDERSPEDVLAEMEAADPSEPRLKPISQDAPVKGGLPAW